MTRQNPGMVIGDWQWAYVHLAPNTGAVETSLGWNIAKYMEIQARSMMVFVKTAVSGKTLDVGILSTQSGGDANGFIAALSLTTAGWIRPAMTVTAGSNSTYISADTFGALFLGGLDGGNAAATPGVQFLKNHLGDGTAKTLSCTMTSNTTFEGWLAFRYLQHPDPSIDNFQWPTS